MRFSEFHVLRKGVQANAHAGSGEVLVRAEEQVRRTLLDSGLFSEVEVERTDDPDRLVIAMATFFPGWTEAEVARRIEELWQYDVAWGFWAAHATLVEESHVELQGATRAGLRDPYLTVHLIAQRAQVPAQREPAPQLAHVHAA